MPRRILEGKVVSDKQDKTITVLVERRYMHPIYKKYVKRTDKYAAHDETNQFKVGDTVEIQECRPLSKNKSWVVIGENAAGVPAVKKYSSEAAPAKPKVESKKAAAPKAEKPKAEKKPAAEKKAAAKKAEK